MNKGKTIFSQIMSLIPERDFKTCVDRYKGNYRARNFSCKDQFLVMSYAQLTGQSKKLLLQRPIPSNELCSINRS
ncbi:DUF4372 domain-containing protein [Bacillus cereus]|nr:DUF4372 domain-containing protein [Bacillus cereus]